MQALKTAVVISLKNFIIGEEDANFTESEKVCIPMVNIM